MTLAHSTVHGLPTVPSLATLPAEYAAAERLAEAMLAAAAEGDWDTVVTLRRDIPGLARSLSRTWSSMHSTHPAQLRALEKQRLGAIRRVLAVDDQIRRLGDNVSAPLNRWLRGTPTTRALN
jgi:hypothetical protein